MRHPSADRLIGDDDPALSEQVLDIPEAEREAQIQPDGVLDDRRREPIAAVAERLHRQTLPALRSQGHGSLQCDKPVSSDIPGRPWRKLARQNAPARVLTAGRLDLAGPSRQV